MSETLNNVSGVPILFPEVILETNLGSRDLEYPGFNLWELNQRVDTLTTVLEVGATMGVIGFLPYLRDTFAVRMKSRAFSWLIWGILTGVTFTAQLVRGAGLEHG